jgi:putative flippase GtrA
VADMPQAGVAPARYKQLIAQFGKYMAGGSLYFWAGYLVFAACYSGLHWSWLPAKILADAIGWSLNYLVQRLWTFRGQIHFIESIGFVLDYLIIGGLNALDVTPYLGFFISAAFFTVWSWLWYKYWVFPETGGKKIAQP